MEMNWGIFVSGKDLVTMGTSLIPEKKPVMTAQNLSYAVTVIAQIGPSCQNTCCSI